MKYSSHSSRIYPYIVIIISICLAFHNSLDCDFTFDDTSAILQNRYVHINETDWFQVFNVDYWGTPIHSEHSHKSYRPLTSLTFRWNHYLWPSNNNKTTDAYGFHLVNIIIHSFVSIVCFELLKIILNQQNQWTACLFTIYFAIHPIKCEAVTSIVGRAELLCTFFILISLFSYFKASYFCFVVSTLLALFSKEQGMTIPLILIAIEGHIFIHQFRTMKHLPICQRIFNRTIFKIITLIIFTAALIGLRIYLTGSSLPIFTKFDNPASFEESPTRQLTYNFLLPLNVGLMLWPKWLCADWTMNSIPLVKTFDDPRNAWTALFYFVFLIFGCRSFFSAIGSTQSKLSNEFDIKRYNLSIALILIVIPFIPASNLFFPVGFVIAERVLYTPSIGFTLLLAIGWLRIRDYFSRSKFLRFLLNISTILMLVILALRTYERNQDWQNDLTLFQSGIKVNPNNAKLYNNIGHYYERLGQWSNAINYFRQAAQKDREDIGAELNVARSLIKLNRLKEAEDLLWSIKPRVRSSIMKNRMIPHYLNIWINLAHVISMNQTRLHEAENLYQEVLSIRNDFVDAYINLGELYIRKNLFDQARETYENALNRARYIDDGKKADLHYNLAIVKSLKLDNQQQKPNRKKLESILTEIAEDLISAIKINREHREAIINLAILLQRPEFPPNNQSEYRQFAIDSLKSYSKSNELESFQFNIAITLLDLGGATNRMMAINHFKRATELKPDYRSALYNLALLYYDFKDYEQSLFYLNRTLEHHSNYTKALLLTADIYSRMGRLDDTEKTYTKVLEMDNHNFEAIHNLCQIYKRLQRKREQEKCTAMLNELNSFKSIM